MKSESLPTIIIIGGSSDIGLSLVKKFFTKKKSKIFVTYFKNKPNLDEDQNLISSKLDVRNPEEIKNFFMSISDNRLASLVYLAGFHKLKPVTALSDGGLDENMNVNFKGAINCARFFYKFADTSCFPSISFISSIASNYGDPGLTAYSASKSALVSATKNLASEFAKKNIRVNSISPGWIMSKKSNENIELYNSKKMHDEMTNRYPLGLGEPEDIANLIYFLTSKNAKWITGSNIIIDGGRSCT